MSDNDQIFRERFPGEKLMSDYERILPPDDEDSIPYLDHGYVRLISVMGDDRTIAQAARTSFGKGAYKSDTANNSLLRYLIEHMHTSPIEAGEMCFEIVMPISVMRQHVRHRTASLSEYSLRYSPHMSIFYTKPIDRYRGASAFNKQGCADPLTPEMCEALRNEDVRLAKEAIESYNRFAEAGLANEVNREKLPVCMYTKCFWKMDTKNLLHYLMLRDEGHAQWEIRIMAQRIAFFVQREFPMLYAAYEEFMKYSSRFSRTEMEILRDLLQDIPQERLDEVIGWYPEFAEHDRSVLSFKQKLQGDL